jgi:formamidopyrimidine-DNA glycosylase
VCSVNIRNPSLRLAGLCGNQPAAGQSLLEIRRRGKYLLFRTESGWFLVHLGMSGSLRLAASAEAPRKHDHVLLELSGGLSLRFHDPRRFGLFLWLGDAVESHPLLAAMGPEPLSDSFTAAQLFKLSRTRSIPVKSFIMDSHMVVGVGNIYAPMTLFHSGIHPLRAFPHQLTARYDLLHTTIRHILGQPSCGAEPRCVTL